MLTRVRRRRLLLAAVAGAALAALGVTIASSHAAASAVRNGRIAVTHVSFRPDCCAVAEDVLTIQPDGSDPQQLTHKEWGLASSDPAWGKNNWIYFDSGPVDGLEHLFRMNANGHGVTQITRGDGSECCATASPDGKLIAFDGYFPAVAPDGAQGIYLTDQHGGCYPDFRRLTVAPSGGFDTQPDISPNGRVVAFRRVLSDSGPDAASAVFLIGIDGQGLRQVTPYSLDADYPRWSPDGTRLVFGSKRDTDFSLQQVWLVNADGSNLTQLTHDPPDTPSFLPDWSPDGSKIVFAHFLPTGFFTQLRVIDLDGSDEHVIWQGADFSYDLRPDWGTRPPRNPPAHRAKAHPHLTPSHAGKIARRLALLALLAVTGAATAATGGPPSELATSNLNTPAGKVTALGAGIVYQAGMFPIALRIRPSDATWAGAQWRTTSHGRPAFGWAAFAQGPPAGPPQGVIEIETAYAATPPASAVRRRLRTAGGGAIFGKTTRVTLAGFPGWQIDGRVYGRFGHVFVPFTPKTGGASPPDSYKLEQGEAFRLVVLEASGKRIVLFLDSAALPAAKFPAFLTAANKLLRTLNLAG